MGIWSNLSKAKTAAQLADEKRGQEQRIAEKEAGLADMRAKVGAGPFENAAFDARAAGAAIRDLESELEADRAVLAEIERRRAEAQRAEANTALEALAAEGRAVRRALLDRYSDIHVAAEALAAAINAVRQPKLRLTEINRTLGEAGRADLEIMPPLSELARLLQPKTPPGEVTGLWRGVADPSEIMTIPDYLPRHPDGPQLAHLGKLKKT